MVSVCRNIVIPFNDMTNGSSSIDIDIVAPQPNGAITIHDTQVESSSPEQNPQNSWGRNKNRNRRRNRGRNGRQNAFPAGLRDGSEWTDSSSSSSPAPPAPSTSQIDTEIRHHIDTGKPWSGPLDKSIRQSFVENLRSKCHSWATLKNTGYRMDPTQKGYQHAPQGGPQKRAAVALDCEMVQTENGQECVQLCAVDMITGEAIVDVGVFPLARVTNWVTRYSGMSWKRLKAMEKKGKTVHGWPSARERLFKYINRDTVLVGHALENDLKTLGIVHDNIVDTSILTKEVVEEYIGVCGRKWALRKLTAAFVGIAIQNSSSGHDCMEDTMATREVLLVCLLKPDVLEQWAVEAAVEEGRVGNGPAYGGVEDFM